MNAHLQPVAPRDVNRKVEPDPAKPVPRRGRNEDARSREYLLPAEIEKLVKAAKSGRWGARDATLITVGFRHGLRATEIARFEWSQVEFGRSARLHVRRAKGGTPIIHPVYGDELRILTALRKARPDDQYVFTTERGTTFTADGVNKLIKIIGARAEAGDADPCAYASPQLAATRWPTAASTPAASNPGWVMCRSRIRRATPP